jgi:hypothetical protein
MFMFGPVGNHTRDAVPDDGFNEVKIVSEVGFKFFNRLDSSLSDKTLKPLL